MVGNASGTAYAVGGITEIRRGIQQENMNVVRPFNAGNTQNLCRAKVREVSARVGRLQSRLVEEQSKITVNQ